MASAFTAKEFKAVLGTFATGVTVITTFADNKNWGITVNSFNSVSLSPPLILFSLQKESCRYSVFAEAKSFAVNILSEAQEDISRRFASHDYHNWQGFHWQEIEGVPILTSTLAYIVCNTYNTYEAGDHLIMLGQCRVIKKQLDANPLLYWGSRYRKVSSLDE